MRKLRIMLEWNTALLTISRVYIAGLTSQLFWIVDTQGKRAPLLPPTALTQPLQTAAI